MKDHRVEVPYAGILAKLCPKTAIRIRRDFGLILNLIKTHAILHQANRERSPEGWIIATVHDYSVIRDLVDDLLAESLETSVSPAIRETVDTVKQLLRESTLRQEELRQEGMAELKRPITQKLVADKLGIDRSTVSRRVQQAIGAGYLINCQERPGRPMDLEIAESMPSDRPALPTAANVQRVMSSCTVARLQGDKGQIQADSEETQENSAGFEV